MCEICRSIGACVSRCPNAQDPKIMGYCKKCSYELREDYEYYTDNDGNKFCSEECAIKFHGIESKEWDIDEME